MRGKGHEDGCGHKVLQCVVLPDAPGREGAQVVFLPGEADRFRGADGDEGYLRVVRQPWDKVPDEVLLPAGLPGHGEPLELLFLPEGEERHAARRKGGCGCLARRSWSHWTVRIFQSSARMPMM